MTVTTVIIVRQGSGFLQITEWLLWVDTGLTDHHLI